MTKLPPGFTHELPQHLQQHGHCVDTVMGVPAFDFEKCCCGEPRHLSAETAGSNKSACRRSWVFRPYCASFVFR